MVVISGWLNFVDGGDGSSIWCVWRRSKVVLGGTAALFCCA